MQLLQYVHFIRIVVCKLLMKVLYHGDDLQYGQNMGNKPDFLNGHKAAFVTVPHGWLSIMGGHDSVVGCFKYHQNNDLPGDYRIDVLQFSVV